MWTMRTVAQSYMKESMAPTPHHNVYIPVFMLQFGNIQKSDISDMLGIFENQELDSLSIYHISYSMIAKKAAHLVPCIQP